MEIFFSAAEASSDAHAAKVLERLRTHGSVNAFGLGGDALKHAGCKLMMHARDFSVMGGPLEVISKLPRRARLERELEKRLAKNRPAGAVLVDNGEINLRLASLFHFFDVPVVYFIPPKVWVWRSSRIEKIADHVSLVLSVLPFEKEIYQNWEIPFEYVGHPIVDEAPKISPHEAKNKLGLTENENVLAVFPGSRHSEVRYHIELFSEVLKRFTKGLSKELSAPTVVVPVPSTLNADEVQSGFESQLQGAVQVRVAPGKNYETLAASRAALVKSGTSTLEAAFYCVPMVLAYRSSKMSEWAYRHVVRYRGLVGMVNLFLEKDSEKALGWKPDEKSNPVVEEFILDRCRPELIASSLLELYRDGPVREKQLGAFEQLHKRLFSPGHETTSPTELTAQAIWEVFTGKRKRENFPTPL